MGKYDDMIYMPHPEPKKHIRMSLENRAAQFSPFAALTGHSDALKETEQTVKQKAAEAEKGITDIEMWYAEYEEF